MQIERMFTTIDTHVAGEAFRVIVHSPFQLVNQNELKDERAVHSFVRQAQNLLLNEPRGHRGINGCIILPSDTADFFVMFLHHIYEKHVSYSGLIATLTVLLESGQIPIKEERQYTVETNKGFYTLSADVANHVVQNVQVTIGNCYVEKTTDKMHVVEVDKTKRYFLYPLPASIPTLEPKHLASIMKWGKKRIDEHRDESFHGIIGVEKIGENAVRSVTFKADGVILRSPGLASTCAILAACRIKRENVSHLRNESVFGSDLKAIVHDRAEGNFTIKAQAFITGEHRFVYDAEDPLESGFLLH